MTCIQKRILSGLNNEQSEVDLMADDDSGGGRVNHTKGEHEAGFLFAAEADWKQRVGYYVINGAISCYSTARSLSHLFR